MKNFNKIVLGFLTVAMAIGLSSFTNGHKLRTKGLSDYLFFRKLTAPAHSNANADYVYRPNGGCIPNAGTICDAYFLQTTAPTMVGQNPTGTYDGTISEDAMWDGD